jgi:hypothetical protein
VHGYIVAFWWVAGIFLFGAIVCGTLMRRGPLQGRAPAPAPAAAGSAAADASAPDSAPVTTPE